MSIELEAGVRATVVLAEVLARAGSLASSVEGCVFTIGTSRLPSDILVAPFAVAEHGPHRYKQLFSIWEHGYLEIAMGRNREPGGRLSSISSRSGPVSLRGGPMRPVVAWLV